MSTKLRLNIMMFLQFFVWGAWYVTMGGYLPTVGFTPEQIGYAYSTTAIAAIVSPFFMGMVADRFFNGERVLGMLHVLGGVLLLVASTITTPQVFLGVVLAHTLCYMPTLALVNSVSFDQMSDPDKQVYHGYLTRADGKEFLHFKGKTTRR